MECPHFGRKNAQGLSPVRIRAGFQVRLHPRGGLRDQERRRYWLDPRIPPYLDDAHGSYRLYCGFGFLRGDLRGVFSKRHSRVCLLPGGGLVIVWWTDSASMEVFDNGFNKS